MCYILSHVNPCSFLHRCPVQPHVSAVSVWPADLEHFICTSVCVCVCVCVCINARLKDTIWVFHMQHFFIKMSKQFVLYVLVSCVLKSSSPEKAYLTASSAYRQIQDDKNVLSPNLCRTELNFDNQSSAAAVTYSSRLWSLGKGLKKKKKPPLSHAPEG